MQQELIGSIKQQSEDLRDELKELEEWEDHLKKLEERRAAKKDKSQDEVQPPIRGSVPSIKEAMRVNGKESDKKEVQGQDPAQLAKERGNEYFRVGKIDDAIHSYSSGIDLDPLNPASHVLYGNRAMCYLKQEKWAEAEKDATVCVQLNRRYAKGYFRRAVARKNLHKLRDARSDLEAVLALAPDDPSAKAELEIVTRMLKVQQEKGNEVKTKRKVVIEEVEDEDDEETDAPAPTSSASKTEPSTEGREEREERIRQQMAKELERVRLEEESRQKESALREEKEKTVTRRQNNRVEVIEEDESPPAAPPTEPPKAPAKDTATEPQPSPPPPKVHTDPTVTPPLETRRSRSKPQKGSLSPPKSFTEFERVFLDIIDDDELRDYYVGLLNPAGLSSLFGSNLTPEILVGLLRSVSSLSGTNALQFLKGICRINRVEDITLFFSPSEKAILEELITMVQSSGAPPAEVAAIKKKLLF